MGFPINRDFINGRESIWFMPCPLCHVRVSVYPWASAFPDLKSEDKLDLLGIRYHARIDHKLNIPQYGYGPEEPALVTQEIIQAAIKKEFLDEPE